MERELNLSDFIFQALKQLGGLHFDELAALKQLEKLDFDEPKDLKPKSTYITFSAPNPNTFFDNYYQWVSPNEYYKQEKTIKELREELNRVYLMFERLRDVLKKNGVDLESIIGDVAKEEDYGKKSKISFPEDFEKHVVKEVSTDGLNNMIKDVMNVELKEGSFVLVETKDGIAIKIKDQDGEAIIVTNNYYVAELDN